MFIKELIAKFITMFIISLLVGDLLFQVDNNLIYSLGIATGSVLVELALNLIKRWRKSKLNNTQI